MKTSKAIVMIFEWTEFGGLDHRIAGNFINVTLTSLQFPKYSKGRNKGLIDCCPLVTEIYGYLIFKAITEYFSSGISILPLGGSYNCFM